jgi:hypothetical protein
MGMEKSALLDREERVDVSGSSFCPSDDPNGAGPSSCFAAAKSAYLYLLVSTVIAMTSMPAQALDLVAGTRFPARANEEIVVRNDGGVRNATHSFAFGETCYSDRYLKTWFIVKRIVGEQVLIELECIPTVFGPSCPNGTETSKSLAETRARVNAYLIEVDTQFMEQLQRFKRR